MGKSTLVHSIRSSLLLMMVLSMAGAFRAVTPRRPRPYTDWKLFSTTTHCRVSSAALKGTPLANRLGRNHRSNWALFSTTSNYRSSSTAFDSTPLGTNGTHLLAGLDVFRVAASGDDHPLAVYGIQSELPAQLSGKKDLHPILLLHGRTWSSVPVYHLPGEGSGEESRSLMKALLAKGLQPYMMDFRASSVCTGYCIRTAVDRRSAWNG
jgi:hypothetical protein